MEGPVLRGFVEMSQFLSLSLPPCLSLFSLLCVCEIEQSVGVLEALFLLVLCCYSYMNSGNPSLQPNCTRNSFTLFSLRIISAARQPVRWTSRSLVAAVIVAVIDECSRSSSSGRWSVIRLSAWVAAGLVLPAAATYLGRVRGLQTGIQADQVHCSSSAFRIGGLLYS
jgi:hypothetical protein